MNVLYAARRWGIRTTVALVVAAGLITATAGSLADPQPARAAGPCFVLPASMTAPTCTLLRSDTADRVDPKAGLWGTVECATESRHTHSHVLIGGDPHLTATALPQLDTAYRRLTAIDNDDFYGERCELGRNEHRYGENSGTRTSGTFAVYREGQRRITFFSQRYPSGLFTSANPRWQTVAQMKQAQPSDAGGGGPIIELQIRGGYLHLDNPVDDMWSTPAPAADTWIRYALDVVYSSDPSVGSAQLHVDKNGDGDALDAGEQSPVVRMRTLKPEIAGTTSDGLSAGDPIPSHLRLGIYHDTGYPCPAPTGCAVDVDNVQVVAP